MNKEQYLERLWELIEADDWDGVRSHIDAEWSALADSLPYEEFVEIAGGVHNYVGMVLAMSGAERVADSEPVEEDEDEEREVTAWDLPPYRSLEFYEILADNNMTLDEFRSTPDYAFGVGQGLIENDVWVASIEAEPDPEPEPRSDPEAEAARLDFERRKAAMSA